MLATSAERVRVHRARLRRGKLGLTIDLHEDDLRQMAVLRELQIATPGRTRKVGAVGIEPASGGRDEFYRLGNGAGDGKDCRSRCPDELFVLARVVCSCLSASTSALLTGTIFSFSVCDEAVFSARAACELSELVVSICLSVGNMKS